MNFTETSVNGAYLIDLRKLQDDRGFFARTFCQDEFSRFGVNKPMVQTNTAYSIQAGTFRGLHMQLPPFSEIKIVRCLRGAIFDLFVDLRPASPTFKQWFGAELSETNNRMLLVPEGCAHGYLTLADHSEVSYQVSAMYTPSAEIGLRWNDPAFGIELPFEPRIISEKDRMQPDFDALLPRIQEAFASLQVQAD